MHRKYNEILENLRRAILGYDKELAVSSAKRAVEEKMDPTEALDALTGAIRRVGEGFEREELWLPDLIAASDTMLSAVPVIEAEIKRRGMTRKGLGTVVAGTVFGDIHNIGKTMVCTLLAAEGFAVHDLGVNIPAEEFVEAVKKRKADILAMSALMTTTIVEQKKVIDMLKKEALTDKVKIMVGGASVTKEFADEIGADGYDPTAPGAARLARVWLEHK